MSRPLMFLEANMRRNRQLIYENKLLKTWELSRTEIFGLIKICRGITSIFLSCCILSDHASNWDLAKYNFIYKFIKVTRALCLCLSTEGSHVPLQCSFSWVLERFTTILRLKLGGNWLPRTKCYLTVDRQTCRE